MEYSLSLQVLDYPMFLAKTMDPHESSKSYFK